MPWPNYEISLLKIHGSQRDYPFYIIHIVMMRKVHTIKQFEGRNCCDNIFSSLWPGRNKMLQRLSFYPSSSLWGACFSLRTRWQAPLAMLVKLVVGLKNCNSLNIAASTKGLLSLRQCKLETLEGNQSPGLLMLNRRLPWVWNETLWLTGSCRAGVALWKRN